MAEMTTPSVVIEAAPPLPNVTVVTGFPSDVTRAFASAVNVVWPFAIVKVPTRFAVRGGSLISDAGSLPAVLAPSCSQNNPRTASHPSGAISSATRAARCFSISARYSAGPAAAKTRASARRHAVFISRLPPRASRLDRRE